MSFSVDFHARSDLGLVRANNEDSAFAGPRLLALADGMGGHAAGEVASQLMIAALAPLDEDEAGSDLTAALVDAMHAGNQAIADAVEGDPSREGMGCTLTALLFDGRRAGLLHVGDSRAYLLRDGELSQITRDDTFVQSMVDEGKLTADEAHSHPQRSLILKALTGHEVEPSTAVREVRAGDRYLLCSDGLSDPVSVSTITETLSNGTPAEATERLVSLALRSGGPDNVTVVVADIVEGNTPLNGRPMVVGAASSEVTDSLAPANSAAAKAAAFTRSQAAGKNADKDAAGAEAEDSTAEDEPPAGKAKARGKLRMVLLALGVTILLAAGAAGAMALMRSNYFVAEDNSRVVVRQGLPGTFLGVSLSSVTQLGCLSADGKLTMFDADAMPADCNVFTLGDLRESARMQVQAGLPAGSLSDANAQLNRLAMNELLPSCEEFGPKPEATPAPDPAADSSSAAPSTSASPQPDDAKPGDGDSDGEADDSDSTESSTPPSSSSASPPTPAAAPGVNCRAVS